MHISWFCVNHVCWTTRQTPTMTQCVFRSQFIHVVSSRLVPFKRWQLWFKCQSMCRSCLSADRARGRPLKLIDLLKIEWTSYTMKFIVEDIGIISKTHTHIYTHEMIPNQCRQVLSARDLCPLYALDMTHMRSDMEWIDSSNDLMLQNCRIALDKTAEIIKWKHCESPTIELMWRDLHARSYLVGFILFKRHVAKGWIQKLERNH